MYDFYPESWGPSNHDPESPHSREAVQAALADSDNDGQRPDDN